MKKITLTVLTLTLLLALAACGQGADNNTIEQDPPQGSAPEIEEQEETVEETDISNEEPTDPASEIAILDVINLYFSDNDLMDIYRVEVGTQHTKDEEGIQSALQLWVKGPKQEGLQGLVPEGVIVQTVEERDGLLYVSFSNELLEANLGSTGEAMLATQITMIVKQFGYDKVFVLIEGEVIDSLLGHLDWNEPLTLDTVPEDFELYTE